MIVLMLTVQTLIVTIGESMVASLPQSHRVHCHHQSLHHIIKIIILNFLTIVIIMMIIIIIIMVPCPQVISPLHLGKKQHGLCLSLSLEAMETPRQVLRWLV